MKKSINWETATKAQQRKMILSAVKASNADQRLVMEKYYRRKSSKLGRIIDVMQRRCTDVYFADLLHQKKLYAKIAVLHDKMGDILNSN